MAYFHGEKQEHSFFEGWYLKHQNKGETIALIPAFHVNADGAPSASIQIITDTGAVYIPFSAEEFEASATEFNVKIGDNLFTTKGIDISIKHKEITVVGKLEYAPFTPLNYDIMGPFKVCKHMQCNHGVLSLAHRLNGSLTVNGQVIDFHGGVGYIEKDWGTSFPKKYLWTQCGWFDGSDNCIMASVAHIPFLKTSFEGCICAILYHGKQYRLATYKGVKVRERSEDITVLTQGQYRLEIRPLKSNPHKLRAPSLGDMSRTIHESAACEVRYTFFVGKRMLFDIIKETASCELVL